MNIGMETFEKWYSVMRIINQEIQKEINSAHAAS